uniref:Uncharacterized protein n=1 Tax=Amphimedon queenslandica TaxID=400682 RepID=A0A1X7T2P4_AMPQE
MGCLSDIDTALGMYYGTSITPAELNEACKAVTGLSVSSHLVDVLFTIFDENITRIRTSQTNELWCGLLCKAVKDKLGIEA